jgi:Flp pilus assembly pilin Flp
MVLKDKVYGLLIALREAQDGQAMVEYALILAFIAVVSIGVLQAMGVSLTSFLTKVSTALSGVAT